METIIVVVIVGLASVLMIRSIHRKITGKIVNGNFDCAGCPNSTTCHIPKSDMEEKESD